MQHNRMIKNFTYLSPEKAHKILKSKIIVFFSNTFQIISQRNQKYFENNEILKSFGQMQIFSSKRRKSQKLTSSIKGEYFECCAKCAIKHYSPSNFIQINFIRIKIYNGFKHFLEHLNIFSNI